MLKKLTDEIERIDPELSEKEFKATLDSLKPSPQLSLLLNMTLYRALDTAVAGQMYFAAAEQTGGSI